MYCELLLRRESVPLRLDVGQGNYRSRGGGGRAGGVRLVGGGSDAAGPHDVDGSKSDSGTRQAECLHGRRWY